MLKSIQLLTVFIGLSFFSFSQENTMSNGIGIGYQITQHQDDFGLGLNLTSPYFANEKLAIRARGNVMWHDHINSDFKNTWSEYYNFSLGFIGVSGKIADFIRIYGEGGVIALLPSSNFSNEDLEIGGYGLFGFEFFSSPHFNYFIELGGVGTGAQADKLGTEPIYSNGFLVNVGFRYQI